MQLKSPRSNWQRNERDRQALIKMLSDPVFQDAVTVVFATLARECSAMPDAAAYMRGAKDFSYTLYNLPDVEKPAVRQSVVGLPNPIKDR